MTAPRPHDDRDDEHDDGRAGTMTPCHLAQDQPVKRDPDDRFT
jgi:hypothetical protein